MTVGEIVNLCNEMCNFGLPRPCHLYILKDDSEKNETTHRLTVCCNSILEDLYCNYFQSIATCNVSAKNGFIDTSKIRLNKVLNLTDRRGSNIKFRYTANGLFVEDGDYVLTYAQRPPVVDWNTEVVLPSPRLTERVMVYGMLAEYFLALEDLELAAAWETRYQNALRAATVKNSHMTMPVGKWS